MHNIKDPSKECYPHLEEIHLRYDRIVWQYLQGNIEFTDRWDYGIFYYGMNKDAQEEYKAVMGDGPAITDALVDEQQNKIAGKLTNLRWEHTDEDKKKNSSDEAASGDIILLKVDTQGLSENDMVSYEILDTTGQPPVSVGKTNAKNKQDKAAAEWKVTTKKSKGGEAKKLAFEAQARGMYTERCTIELKESNFGYISIKLVDTLLLPWAGITTIFSDDTQPQMEVIVSEDGVAAWKNIPFGEYSVKIKFPDQEISMKVPWQTLNNRNFVIQHKRF
jgi:hypothetical protein